jgi:hypothetical protein
MLGRHVPLLLMTDSRSLLKVIVNHKKPEEGRLMLDVYAVREAYRCLEIDNLALVRSEYNVADALTKIDGNDALLRILMCVLPPGPM